MLGTYFSKSSIGVCAKQEQAVNISKNKAIILFMFSPNIRIVKYISIILTIQSICQDLTFNSGQFILKTSRKKRENKMGQTEEKDQLVDLYTASIDDIDISYEDI